MKPILLVLTGGTICSFGDEYNKNRDVDVKKARRLILENFEKSDSKYKNQEFETEYILDTLSENMTIAKWNQLIEFFDGIDFEKYSGVIIAHGTDTLAYTACLVSLYFLGKNLPVFLVSSQLPLSSSHANGNENFKVAVSLINEGVHKGAFVPYRNSDGKMYLHIASKLHQCRPYSEDFFSRGYIEINMEEPQDISENVIISINNAAEKNEDEIMNYKSRFKEIFNSQSETDRKVLKEDVLMVEPYVGLDYGRLNLDGLRGVVHSLYHSSTACVERSNPGESYTSNSILYLIDQCKKRNIPVIVTPCYENENDYISGADMIKSGAVPVYGLTTEMVYVLSLFVS